MRGRAQTHAAGRWLVWQQVVAATRPAQPYWTFTDRHQANPGRFPLAAARAQYLAQPRVAAMSVYNALPHRVCHLPLAELEAFQLGPAGYAWLAWLAAVPADGISTTGGGGLIAPAGVRLAEQVDYLQAANAHLARLPRPPTWSPWPPANRRAQQALPATPDRPVRAHLDGAAWPALAFPCRADRPAVRRD